MKHGLWLRADAATDPATLVERAVAADAAGWDGVFVSDSLPYVEYPDPWVTLAGMAARTSDVALGTWVTPLPRRQPWQVASEVAALDRLSGGRVILGAGLGNSEDYEAFGRPYEPRDLGDRFDEALDVVTGLWADGPFSYDGEHFTHEDADVQPTPVQRPRPPILTGCWWPNEKPFHRGADWDGIMPYWPALTGEGAGPHGEETEGTAEEQLREMMAFYHDVADDPGEVLLPTIPDLDPGENADLCEEVGGTWLLATDLGESPDEQRRTIQSGPPG